MFNVNDFGEKFINYLVSLRERDSGAMAMLRHSLAFAPGTYPKAYPYVEPFVAESWHTQDSRRLALYGVAALFARYPVIDEEKTFPQAFAVVCNKRDSNSLERRFIAILDADSDTIFDYLRHAISLIATEGIGFNYAGLRNDLVVWMNRINNLDRLRQKWAKDFYRVYDGEVDENSKGKN